MISQIIKRLFLIQLLGTLFVGLSFADMGSSLDQGGLGTRARRRAQPFLDRSPGPAPKGIISGQCVVLPGTANLGATCVNLVLVLSDSNGKELLRTRTNANGEFEFSADIEGKYKITVGSSFYDVVSPTEIIHGEIR